MALVPGRANQYVGKRQYSSYYSGTDIRIFFGGMWVDEIVDIQFSIHEQVAPIFGYASYTWDKVARGNRFVKGSFTINFKEVGYLQTILNSLGSKQTDEKTWNDYSNLRSSSAGTGHVPYHSSVETLIGNFDKLANDYENALWGKNSNQGSTIKKRKKGTFFYNTEDDKSNQSLRDHGFNIVITYGDTSDVSRGPSSPKTTQTIVGVQLGDMHTRVDPSGSPVQEVYEFIAKDISGDASKAY